MGLKIFQKDLFFKKKIAGQVGRSGWPLWLASAPTFEDFKRLEGGGMGQRGKERQVIMEESGVLRVFETPSGDLLGYRL